MNTISQRDQLFQAAQHLSFDDLKHLCQTNRAYQALCAEPRFQDLIQRRYSETIQAKVQKILDLIKTKESIFLAYEFIKYTETPTVRIHELVIMKHGRGGKIDLEEQFADIPLQDLILYQYYKEKTGFKGIENLSEQDVRDIFSGLDPNTLFRVNEMVENNTFSDDKLLNIVMKKNRGAGQFDEKFSANTNSSYMGRLTLENPTTQSLREVITYIVKNYPNTTYTLL